MKKFILCLAAAMVMLGAGSSFAACTQEELQVKAMTVSTQIQALAQKDPAKFQQVIADFQQKSTELQANMEALCQYYDEMIEATK